MRRRRVLTLPVILVLLFAFVLNASGSVSAPQAVADFSILLGRPTDHSVTANVIPDQSGQISLEYGATPSYGSETTATACTANEPVEVVIDGLTADTEYYYQVRFRATSGDPWTGGGQHSFHTQRAPGSPFTFTIISDSHLGQYGGQTTEQRNLYQRSLTHIAAEPPDFHIDLGDTFAMDPLAPYGTGLGNGMTEANADAAYRVQRQPASLNIIGAEIPFFLAIGNHENEEGWNWDDVFTPPEGSLAIRGIKARKLYIPNPVPDDFYTGNTDTSNTLIEGDHLHEDYYAWEWGDALFVVLDPFHYSMTWPNDNGAGYGGEGADGEASGDRWDWTLGKQQYDWLKATLEDSDATWKFVFTHHLTGGVIPYGRGGIAAAELFEWGGKNADGTEGFATERPGWEMPIHDLLVANDVDILFHGHDHFFSKEELDGIVYLEVPKPDDITSTTDYRNDGGGYPTGDNIQLACGHIRVDVSADQVQVDYVRSLLSGNDGEILYSFTLPPPVYDLTVAVNPVGAATTNPAAGVHSYPEDTAVNVTATPNTGYAFSSWSGDCSGSTCSVTMTSAKTVTANFVEVGTITSAATPSAGTVAVGGQVVVSINIDMSGATPSGAKLGSFTGSLAWDPAVLSYVSNSGPLGGFTGAVNAGSGSLSFNGANSSGATGNTVVYQVTFNAVGAGTSVLDLGYTVMAAATTFANLLPQLAITDGQVVVSADRVLGDVNGDGAANSTDALIVLSADADMDTAAFCPMNCGDANGDGLVNSTDALIILSYDALMSVQFPVGTAACPATVTPPPGCGP